MLQLDHRWDSNAWEAKLSTEGSWVHGTQDAIAYTQTLNRHLFQRPDAKDVTYDPTLTSLSGPGATWKIGRMGETKHWRFGFGGDMRSPGLELVEVGNLAGAISAAFPTQISPGVPSLKNSDS